MKSYIPSKVWQISVKIDSLDSILSKFFAHSLQNSENEDGSLFSQKK